MHEVKSTAKASVGEAGSAQVDTLQKGKVEIKIVDVSPEENGRMYVTCEYPKGFKRDHHVTGPDDLVAKIVNQLFGRYGAADAKPVNVPALKKGSVIIMEV